MAYVRGPEKTIVYLPNASADAAVDGAGDQDLRRGHAAISTSGCTTSLPGT